MAHSRDIEGCAADFYLPSFPPADTSRRFHDNTTRPPCSRSYNITTGR